MNHNLSAENEIPSSPESNISDNTTIDYHPEEVPERSVDHEPHPNCPDSLDCLPDTEGRPQHTLPVILRSAILGSPRKRLTIREIYAAMEGKYDYYRYVQILVLVYSFNLDPFYRTAGPTWKVRMVSGRVLFNLDLFPKQSVRHHLSLNRLFERQPRPATDPGTKLFDGRNIFESDLLSRFRIVLDCEPICASRD